MRCWSAALETLDRHDAFLHTIQFWAELMTIYCHPTVKKKSLSSSFPDKMRYLDPLNKLLLET